MNDVQQVLLVTALNEENKEKQRTMRASFMQQMMAANPTQMRQIAKIWAREEAKDAGKVTDDYDEDFEPIESTEDFQIDGVSISDILTDIAKGNLTVIDH